MTDDLRDKMKDVKSIALDDCSFGEAHLVDADTKSRIVEYLRSNELAAMCGGWMTDRFTGEQVIGWRPNFRTDGAYAWGESLAYYLDKYDLELPADFLAHIYEKLGVGGSLDK